LARRLYQVAWRPAQIPPLRSLHPLVAEPAHPIAALGRRSQAARRSVGVGCHRHVARPYAECPRFRCGARVAPERNRTSSDMFSGVALIFCLSRPETERPRRLPVARSQQKEQIPTVKEDQRCVRDSRVCLLGQRMWDHLVAPAVQNERWRVNFVQSSQAVEHGRRLALSFCGYVLLKTGSLESRLSSPNHQCRLALRAEMETSTRLLTCSG
jgi:hypothetical protein